MATTTPPPRQRRSALIFATLSLVVAGSTAWLVSSWVQSYEASLVQDMAPIDTHQLVVAARDLATGTLIQPDDITLATRPGGAPPFTFDAVEDLLGSRVSARILEGEAVREERVGATTQSPYLEQLVEPGSRAATVRVSRESAVGGHVRPGSNVDVIVTIRPDSPTLTANWVTDTILQGVRVVAVNSYTLGVDHDASPELAEDRARSRELWVTLEVTPPEAQQLALASARGQLHLALRHHEDFELLESGKPLVSNALVGLPPPVVRAQQRRLEKRAAEAPAGSVEVIRGQRIDLEHFDEAGQRIHTPESSRSKRRGTR